MTTETRIEKSIDAIQNRISDVVMYYYTLVGKRLKNISEIEDLQTYLYSAEAIDDANSDLRKIKKALNAAHRQNTSDMNSLFKDITAEVYSSGREMAEHKGTRLSTIASYRQEASPLLRQAVRNYEVMSKSVTVNDTYKKTIRQYVNRLTTGDEEYAPMAMRKAIRELTKQGITTIDYKSGRSVRMDTVVRNSLMTEYTNIVQNIERKLGEEIGADGVEISAHQHSAEDHEPIQGRTFTNAEFEKLQNGEEAQDIEGEIFQTDRPIGMWNCRHLFFPVLIGISEPSFSQEELEAMKERNQDGIEFQGEHYTLYEAEQKQRQIEAGLRQQREYLNLYKEVRSTSPELERDYQRTKRNIAGLRNEYKELGAALEPKAMRSKWERSFVPKGSTGNATLPAYPDPQQSAWSPNFQEKVDRIRDYNSPHDVDTGLLDTLAKQSGYKNGQDFTSAVNDYIKTNQSMARFDMNEVLKYWADDPVMKNQFETGTSHGAKDASYRNKWESLVAGETINGNTMTARERPIYGFIGNAQDIKNNTADGYGESYIIFKDTVKSRSTFTIGNSSEEQGAFTTDVRSMFNKGRSIDPDALSGSMYNSRSILNHRGSNYMEAQIWGSADIRKDVEKIVLGGTDIDFVMNNMLLLNQLKSKIGNVPIEDMSGNKL